MTILVRPIVMYLQYLSLHLRDGSPKGNTRKEFGQPSSVVIRTCSWIHLLYTSFLFTDSALAWGVIPFKIPCRVVRYTDVNKSQKVGDEPGPSEERADGGVPPINFSIPIRRTNVSVVRVWSENMGNSLGLLAGTSSRVSNLISYRVEVRIQALARSGGVLCHPEGVKVHHGSFYTKIGFQL